ncbi:GNAT family N-acetyltransferase [Paenibacillus sp. TRM 82003]|nr:GNAT family N-acetyltransferase [Paenibacillus sp. TRM 82003]
MHRLRVDEEIELKVLQLHHAGEVFSTTLENKAYLSRWLPWVEGTFSSDDTLSFIANELEKFAARRGMTFGIWLKGAYAGNVSFNTIDLHHRKAEIGYWLAERYTGRGVMTRSCRALLDYAFGDLRLHRVEIRSAVGNAASRAIPERLGFTLEGIVRGAERIAHGYVDHAIYGMLEDEWAAKQAGT